mgnify:CR=1 FL=1
MNVCVLTISDSGYKGQRKDLSGDVIQKYVEDSGHSVVQRSIIPDDPQIIRETLERWTDSSGIDVVFTTGGTGLSTRDNTPEATIAVSEYLIPGIPEAMRLKTFDSTPYSILSRAVAGVRLRSIIINLPGSVSGVNQCIDVIFESVVHAVQIVQDCTEH